MSSATHPQPPTPQEFVQTALGFLLAAFDQDFDVPELWKAFQQVTPADAHVLYPILTAARRSRLVRLPHPHQHDALEMLLALTSLRAGLTSAEELLEFASALLPRRSQSPLVTGFYFHAKGLAEPDNPLYRLDDKVCPVPFNELDVLEKSTHLCCASWLHKSAGDMSTQSYAEIWNSDAAAAIRRSVVDGSFRFCNKNACLVLAGGLLTPRAKLEQDPAWSPILREKSGRVTRLPRKVNLAYDRHCNLSCPSCRTELVTSDEATRARLDQITQNNVFPLLASAEEVCITGSGDPFASKTFRRLLAWISDETCPNLKIVLMTNGMLFTPKEWAKFPNLKQKIKLVKVSLDGATKESHELLRRGSRWEVMQENLPFIGELLQQGEIENYELVFVVQRQNFREMGDFVDLAKRVGANQVYFERMTNWGTFSTEEYLERAVFSPNHPLHAEFLQAMRDPRLADPMVLIGSLREFLPATPGITPVAVERGTLAVASEA